MLLSSEQEYEEFVEAKLNYPKQRGERAADKRRPANEIAKRVTIRFSQ